MPVKRNSFERRHFLRHSLCFPIKYKVIIKDTKKKTKEFYSITNNIGRGGLLFSSNHPANTGSIINIKLPLLNKVFNIKANVIHCNKIIRTDLYNIGVSFCRSSDAFKTKLVEQMYLILEYRDLRKIQLGREISIKEASKEWIKHYSKRFEKLYW